MSASILEVTIGTDLVRLDRAERVLVMVVHCPKYISEGSHYLSRSSGDVRLLLLARTWLSGCREVAYVSALEPASSV